MTFLAGWGPIALAAGLTVPPLVALYFLKLRRAAMPVSSTLLWKRAVEDLQVNAPFQRIRNNLLLWLQLLILALAAFSLGKPVMQAQRSDKDTLVALIDQSASMNVEEADGRTRLEIAKDQAKTAIDNMPDGSKAMVIAFSDRARVVSTFETDRNLVKQRIDELEPTESTSTLSEAMTLAEAYMQNLVIAGDGEGADIEVKSTAGPARAIILTDGNVADAANLTVKRLPTEDMEVVCIGSRNDNVAIVSMDAKRNYEQPAMLEVFASVRNFGDAPVSCDANLYINDEHVDVQSMLLQPGRTPGSASDEEESEESDSPGNAGTPGFAGEGAGPPPGSVASVAFDGIEYEGEGIVEVRLRVEDALESDNVAWTIVPPPRNVRVLLVTAGDLFLERLLPTLPIEMTTMTPTEYESADESKLSDGNRSLYDVVILENHSTDRLPPGAYFFLGGVPLIDGVSAGEPIDDEIIFNWDESHPVLRYVAVETVQILQWLKLTLPPQAEVLMEGESGPILAMLTQDGRQYLIAGFGILTKDEISGAPMLNTNWVAKAHFPVFFYNAIQYLAGSLAPTGVRSIRPGEPMEFPVPEGAKSLQIHRPDSTIDTIPTEGFATANYARTRLAGIYRAEPAVEGHDCYAVNLFSAKESDVAPKKTLTLSGEKLEASEGLSRVNKPVWPWFLLGILAVLAIEWAIYSKRVYV